LNSVLLAVVVIAVLYSGREVLVPIALAILLSVVLAPLVRFDKLVAIASDDAVPEKLLDRATRTDSNNRIVRSTAEYDTVRLR